MPSKLGGSLSNPLTSESLFHPQPRLAADQMLPESWAAPPTPLKANQTVFENSQADHKWLVDILEKYLGSLDRTTTLGIPVSLHCTAPCLSQAAQDRHAAQRRAGGVW